MRSNRWVAIGNDSNVISVVAAVLTVWPVLVPLLGVGGALVRPLGTLPFPIVIDVMLPIFVLGALFQARRLAMSGQSRQTEPRSPRG